VDRSRLEGVEQSLVDELSAYLLEHARRERLALLSRPQIEFRTDERLSLGEFGIQTRLVRPPEESAPSQEPEPASHGNTMIYSTAGRIREQVEQVQGPRHTRALLVAEGRRHVIPPGGALVGRSRECDIVLADANVSRRHAEVRPAAAGTWTVADLGSTNGVLVNGHRIGGIEPLHPGDRIVLGTADIGFEVE
jgi:predicted component of type VI protein secretion system